MPDGKSKFIIYKCLTSINSLSFCIKPARYNIYMCCCCMYNINIIFVWRFPRCEKGCLLFNMNIISKNKIRLSSSSCILHYLHLSCMQTCFWCIRSITGYRWQNDDELYDWLCTCIGLNWGLFIIMHISRYNEFFECYKQQLYKMSKRASLNSSFSIGYIYIRFVSIISIQHARIASPLKLH